MKIRTTVLVAVALTMLSCTTPTPTPETTQPTFSTSVTVGQASVRAGRLGERARRAHEDWCNESTMTGPLQSVLCQKGGQFILTDSVFCIFCAPPLKPMLSAT